jgi:hypothetical protein
MDEEEYQPTLWDKVSPTLFTIAGYVMTAAFIAAGLAAVYFFYNLFSGNLAQADGLPPADRARITGVINLAGQILLAGLAIGTLAAAFILVVEETTGYFIAVAAIAIGFGVQFAYQTFGGTISSQAMRQVFGAFQNASYVPLGIGVILIVRDVIARFISAMSSKDVDQTNLTFGSEAQAERKPLRTGIYAKCWEGPYCRDSIRVHCPIYVERRTCWKELRGCYCEEDIVIQAAQKAQGVPLQMAPDAKYNFANAPTPAPGLSAVGGATPAVGPVILSIGRTGVVTDEENFGRRKTELTITQKKQRCKSCILYNEHMREKYKILMPFVLGGGVLFCLVFSGVMRESVGMVFGGMERLAHQIAMSSGPGPRFSRPPEPIEWAMVGAFSLMILSKMLQTLEWVCFKAKI